jgi:hypothetical protein
MREHEHPPGTVLCVRAGRCTVVIEANSGQKPGTFQVGTERPPGSGAALGAPTLADLPDPEVELTRDMVVISDKAVMEAVPQSSAEQPPVMRVIVTQGARVQVTNDVGSVARPAHMVRV